MCALSTDQSVYVWTLQIVKRRLNGCIEIGIADGLFRVLYAFDGFYKIAGKTYEIYRRNGGDLEKGDVVTMTLDLATKQLSYAVNGSDQGIAFERITAFLPRKYRLAVKTEGCNKVVKLLSFRRFKK